MRVNLHPLKEFLTYNTFLLFVLDIRFFIRFVVYKLIFSVISYKNDVFLKIPKLLSQLIIFPELATLCIEISFGAIENDSMRIHRMATVGCERVQKLYV